MDPNTPPSVQNAQNQTQSDGTSVTDELQQLATQPKPSAQKPKMQQISVGGGIEEGASVMIAENPDADEDDEDELQVAPQEKKNLGVMGQGDSEEQDDKQQAAGQPIVTDVQEAEPELRPSVPEFEASPEIEKIVEKAPSAEPVLTQELKDAGVTHSGLGVIDASSATFAPAKIPVSYDTAVVEEKQTQLHDSKHWLMGKIMYLWRKINPNVTIKKPAPKKIEPVSIGQTTQPKSENVVS